MARAANRTLPPPPDVVLDASRTNVAVLAVLPPVIPEKSILPPEPLLKSIVIVPAVISPVPDGLVPENDVPALLAQPVQLPVLTVAPAIR